MNVCVAIKSCNERYHRLQAGINTWMLSSHYPIFVFVAASDDDTQDYSLATEYDAKFELVVVEGLDDTYAGLPFKTHVICEWALENNFDSCILMDDDCYLQTHFINDLINKDYWGFHNFNEGGYCWGAAYGMSRKSLEIIAKSTPTHGSEDSLSGNLLRAAGIEPTYTDKILLVPKIGGHNIINWSAIPPDFIGVGELSEEAMYDFHQRVSNGELVGTGPLSLPRKLWHA